MNFLSFFPELTLTENIHFLFIGESANMTCSIQKQSIQNFSAANFYVSVKRCGVNHQLPKTLIETSDLMEMYVTDPIRDLHCEDQNQIKLEYKCVYETKNGTSCPVGERDLIYFDCKKNFFHILTQYIPLFYLTAVVCDNIICDKIIYYCLGLSSYVNQTFDPKNHL